MHASAPRARPCRGVQLGSSDQTRGSAANERTARSSAISASDTSAQSGQSRPVWARRRSPLHRLPPGRRSDRIHFSTRRLSPKAGPEELAAAFVRNQEAVTRRLHDSEETSGRPHTAFGITHSDLFRRSVDCPRAQRVRKCHGRGIAHMASPQCGVPGDDDRAARHDSAASVRPVDHQHRPHTRPPESPAAAESQFMSERAARSTSLLSK